VNKPILGTSHARGRLRHRRRFMVPLCLWLPSYLLLASPKQLRAASKTSKHASGPTDWAQEENVYHPELDGFRGLWEEK